MPPAVSEHHKLQRGKSYRVCYHGGQPGYRGKFREIFVRGFSEEFVWVIPAGRDGELNSYYKHLIGEVQEIEARPATRSRTTRT